MEQVKPAGNWLNQVKVSMSTPAWTPTAKATHTATAKAKRMVGIINIQCITSFVTLDSVSRTTMLRDWAGTRSAVEEAIKTQSVRAL